MLELAMRAALLDGSVYKDVVDREEAMFSALGVVLVAAVAFGLGMWSVLPDDALPGLDLPRNLSLVVTICTTFTSWFVWSILAWLLGRLVFAGHAGYRATLRAIGICYAPIALLLFIGTPFVAPVFLVMGSTWPLASVVVAIRHTHRIAWWQAVICAVVGWFWAIVVIPPLFVFMPLATPA